MTEKERIEKFAINPALSVNANLVQAINNIILLQSIIDRQAEQLKAAREALEFYEDSQSWDSPPPYDGEVPAFADEGRRAKAALEKMGGE